MTASEFEDAPPRWGATAVVVVATLAVLAVAVAEPTIAGLGAVGVAVLGAGAFRGSRRLVTAGAAVVFVANLVAAFAGNGGPVLAALVGGALAVAAWDIAEHGVGLGEHVGGAARTRHAELVHAAVTLVVALLAVTVGYLVYLVGADQRPIVALVLLAAGALVLFGALRPDE